MDLKFYCPEEQVPSHFFEAMQIFAHIYGMPEVVAGAECACACIAVPSADGGARTVSLDVASARKSASVDRLCGEGLLEISEENLLKRYLYEVLSNVYGYESPWGCMTGVRPAKIVNKL